MGCAGSEAGRFRGIMPFRPHCMCGIRMWARGESTSVLHASKIRLSETVDTRSARQLAEALGVWHAHMDGRLAALAVADLLEDLYTKMGVPTRLRQLDIPRDDLRTIANETLNNFNANAGIRSEVEQIEDAMRLLEAAY